MTLSSKEKKLYALARQAIVSAGDQLLKTFSKVPTHERSQYAEEAYQTSEKIMIDIIANIFGKHNIVTPQQNINNNSELSWHLNPLDGFSNYSHHIPVFGCSLSLFKRNEQVLGMVYLPVTKEFFRCFNEKAVWMNNKKLESLKDQKKKVSDLYITYCHSRDQYDQKKAHDYLGKIQHKVQEMNKINCASLGLSLLIRGVYDGFIAPGLPPISYEAPAFIATQIGANFKITKDETVMIFAPGVEESLRDAVKEEEK